MTLRTDPDMHLSARRAAGKPVRAGVGMLAGMMLAVGMACGGVEDAPSHTDALVVVSPSDASVISLGTAAFTAIVTGLADTRVAWSIAEGTSGGSIGQNG